MPSLLTAARQNAGEKEPFHLFEMANVYLPKKGDLPDEKMTLGGIFANTSFREAKGVVEGLVGELNVKSEIFSEDAAHYLPNRHIYLKVKGKILGEFGELSQGYLYYEFDAEALREAYREIESFKPIPKYPAQIEDLTFSFPSRTKIGEVIDYVFSSNKSVAKMELGDIYNENYTFRLWYQHPDKTLTDIEVEKVRNQLTKGLKNKFGAIVKS